MLKMSWSKFSISSLDCLKLVMTSATLKIYFYLWSHNTKALTSKERNMQKLHNMFAHQIKGFSIFVNHTTNHQYKSQLILQLFNMDMIVSSFDTICLKNKSSSSIIINSTTSLIGFKWKKTYNKKGHTILISYSSITFRIACAWPTKSHITFMFLK